ncbi:MAG: hypothetical protein CMK59_04795 [Proteobacteria bacterium]|nr:hypothetical protein [Pseudomonadota bacterium]
MTEPLIKVLETPNPDAHMFRVNEMLIPSGTVEFKKGDPLGNSPLASQILTIPNIELILIAPRFITVRKKDTVQWDGLADMITDALKNFLDSGDMAVFETPNAESDEDLTELEQKVLQLLNDDVRPAIAMDGGDFIYHGIEDGIVQIELIGACGSCPSSTATLYNGIQNLIMEEYPEIKGINQIFNS